MKTLLLCTCISCLSPFVFAQIRSLPNDTSLPISKSNRHSDAESKDNRVIGDRSFWSPECAKDLQVYLDLNSVCNKLTLAGPRNSMLKKNDVTLVSTTTRPINSYKPTQIRIILRTH